MKPLRNSLRPAQLLVVSFLSVIGAGTALLSLPAATQTGERLPFVDALFTAISATCVTGLVVVDTGRTFTVFGQLVILGCIQIGALGLMTFTTVFAILLGRRMAIADRAILQSSFHHSPAKALGGLVAQILLLTAVFETVGAGVLAARWLGTGRFESAGEAIYAAVFHAISAFCNAGFSLFPDSLVAFQTDSVVQITMALLIIAGGLGFLVAADLRHWGMARTPGRPRARLSLHSRLVLVMTVALLMIGTVSYYLLERQGVYAQLTGGQAWLNAFFASVTARTAGFNTVDYAMMGAPALLCTMVLMAIGASPGSTGGGIKTSTFGLLVAFAVWRLRGFSRLHLFGRTVPRDAVDRAAAVVVASLTLILLGASGLILAATVGQPGSAGHEAFVPVLFETVSAFGTVGLSLGETPRLTTAGKLITSVVMLMGRVGPLTVAVAIGTQHARATYRYAEENVMIG